MFKKQQARAAYQLCLWALLAMTFAALGKTGEVKKLFSDINDIFAILAPLFIAIVILGILSFFNIVLSSAIRMIAIEESFGILYAVSAIVVVSNVSSIIETFFPRSDGVWFGASWYIPMGIATAIVLIVQIYALPMLAAYLLARSSERAGTFAT